jgi:cholesterol transport system auxiliary component
MKSLAFTLLAAAVLCGCATNPKWKQQVFAFSTPSGPDAAPAGTNIVSLSRVSISPLFQSRSFTYKTGTNAYERDPYADFSIAPERALAEPIRAWMRQSGAFGHVVEPDSGLTPNLVAEVSVSQLYGDFQTPSKPVGKMEIRFVLYEVEDGIPGRVVLDTICARETPLTRKTPAALMAAWDTDLREIMAEISSQYAKVTSKER